MQKKSHSFVKCKRASRKCPMTFESKEYALHWRLSGDVAAVCNASNISKLKY
jgi:hypothetical protein